jgi:serine/threonine protein kinase
VFKGRDVPSGELVAIKVARTPSAQQHLKYESYVYDQLGHLPGLPKKRWFGRQSDYSYLVLDYLPFDMHRFFRHHRDLLAADAVAASAVYLVGFCYVYDLLVLTPSSQIQRLKEFHRAGWIHGDIKPGNMAMGLLNGEISIYLIDLSTARKWGAGKRRAGRGFEGNLYFASIHACYGLRESHQHSRLALVLIESSFDKTR